MKGFQNFKDVGIKESNFNRPIKAKSSGVNYPSVTIDAESFPYLSGKGIGDQCNVLMQIKVTGKRMAENYDSNKENKLTFDIIKIAEPKADEYDEIMEGEAKNKD